MKNFLLTLSIAMLSLITNAQVTVNVTTAGRFSAALTAAGGDANTVTNLVVTGTIDASDVKFMRDNMPVLAILDMSGTSISEYNGTNGTHPGEIIFPANKMPDYSFFNSISFLGKASLTSIKLPNSITSIGHFAFYACNGLTGNLNIPNSVTLIETRALAECSGLTGDIKIPNAVDSIEAGAFARCSNIISFSISAGNVKFSVVDGVLFNSNKTELLQCPPGKIASTYIIPNSVTSIGAWAFSGCKKITGILKIPNSITYIGHQAFYECSGLTGDLVIPNSVLSLESSAFAVCGFTGKLIIPNSISIIEVAAFSGTKFTSLTIPSSIDTIKDAFYTCTDLQKITVAIKDPLPIRDIFTSINKTTCELVVPIGSKAAYQAANYWKDFTNITEAVFVMYNTQGGSAINDTIVNSNTSIVAPRIPIKAGRSFLGWYKEAACSNVWNFATDVVTTNTTLYAKWSGPTAVSNRKQTSLNLFPNPGTDNIKIEGERLQTVTICNIWGTEQLQLNLKGEVSTMFSIAKLNPGYYLVIVKTIDGNESMLKLIKE